MNSRLAGRVALVTGGGRGIGAAVAHTFARAGARLFLVARTRSELETVSAELRREGADAEFRAIDVADQGDVARAVAACGETLGAVDILVNAAGIYGPIGNAWEVDPAAWARTVSVNLLGCLHACQAVIPQMIERGRGRIINFSGGGATAPLPRFSAYAATKAAVVRLTETLAEELKPHGVRVNAVAPGAIDTRLQDDVLAAGERAGDLHERIRRLRESGTGSTPIEVPAELALFLASDASGDLSGKLISAPHDGWRGWNAADIAQLMEKPWLTLRRLDEFTLRPLIEDLAALR